MFPEFYAYFTAAGTEEEVYQNILQDLQGKRSAYRLRNTVQRSGQLSFDLWPAPGEIRNSFLPYTVLTFDGVRFKVCFSLNLTVHILMLVACFIFYIAGIFICISSPEKGFPPYLFFLLPSIIIIAAYAVLYLSSKAVFSTILQATKATSRTKIRLKKRKRGSC